MTYRHLPASLALAVLTASAFSPEARADVLPVSPGTVIEWQSPELARMRKPYAWMRHRITAVDGHVVRFEEEEEGVNPEHGFLVTREAYRGLGHLFFQVDQFNPERPDDRSRTIQRFLIAPSRIEALFPLAAGKRARLEIAVEQELYLDLGKRPETFRFEGGAEDFVVERQETVEVPAGRFVAYVVLIERIGTYDLKNPDDHKRRERRAERIWYAPALGWAVKREEGFIKPEGFVPYPYLWHVVAIKRP